jgi:hypothetical protein
MAKRKTTKQGRPKQGRPKLDKDKARGVLLQIRLNAAEKQAFSDAAEFSGESMSAWARAALRRIAREKLEEFGKPVPFLPFQPGDGGV